MSLPCAGAKLGGCRVRDLASCFLACRISLEEEEPDISRSKPQSKTLNRSIAPDSRKTSESKRRHVEEHAAASVQSSSHHTCSGGCTCRATEGEPRFAEEDYIVFCFGEDGEIQMINDAKSSETYTRPSSEAAATLQPCITRKGGEMEEEMNPNPSKMDSFESCESNLSDTSTTSSFSFPALGMEWIGSPVHMPNTEKHEAPSLLRRCCRFIRRLH
ncbi:hypothetical protein C2S52_001532 [Perilla frutescens var. hirtella]|nr:hypothetical protein C2S52_001532 [Perilla frutescens var. hirtella]